MSSCSWHSSDHNPCPRPAAADSSYCIWHNPQVTKDNAYIIPLLEQELLLRDSHAEGFRLRGLIWPQAELPGAILREADLRDAVLPQARLRAADLRHADCSRAHLAGADLTRAQLAGADLTGTHLAGACLRDADLRGARIDGTIFLACDLRGADLSDAIILEFSWNTLTQFSDIQGFSAPQPRGDTSADETVPFPSPLAANAHRSPSPAAPDSLSGWDPAQARTRIYRSLARRGSMSAEAYPALEAKSRSKPAAPAAPPPAPLARGKQQRLLAMVVFATVWAVAATALASYQQFLTQPSSHNLVQVDPRPTVPRLDSGDDGDSEEVSFLRQLQERENQLTQLRQSNQRLSERLAALDQQNVELRASLSRLNNAADENVVLRQTNQQLRNDLREQGFHARRLEETADILVTGNERLGQENQQLAQQADQRFAELEEASRYLAERDRARERLAAAEERLARISRERNSLRSALEQSSANLERFLTRLEGTNLETLLHGSDDRGPLLQLQPGETLSLGGDDVLLSVRVERSDRPGRVRVLATMQRGESGPLPDLSMMLYGEDGQALRRLAFSFPGHQRGRLPFSTVSTEIDSPSFPTAIRVSAAHGLDDRRVSSAPNVDSVDDNAARTQP